MSDAIEFSTVRCRTMADDSLRLEIDIEPRDAAQAFQAFGARGVHGAIVRLNIDPTTGKSNQKGPYGGYWRALIASGFFRRPEVLRAIGTEKEFESWLRTKPSVLDGNSDWDSERGEGRCEVCHVRSVAEGAGVAEKPPYFAVPMTHEQHAYQHQHGGVAAINKYRGLTDQYADAAIEPDQWFARQANSYRVDWASKTLAARLSPGNSSRSEVPASYVREWAETENIESALPESLR